MTIKFREVMTRRNELLHRQAVWQEVAEHLSKFLDTDATPASIGIKTDGGCLVVPQDIIDSVLYDIGNEYLGAIDKELDKINRSEVAENGRQKHRGKTKVKAKKEVKKVKRKEANKTPAARPKPNKRKVGARK